MKKKFYLLGWLLLFPFFLQADSHETIINEIKANFAETALAWNQGQLEKVMAGYLDSESTVYISSDPAVSNKPTMIVGFDSISDYLAANYPSQAEMGQISFSNVQVRVLSPEHCLAYGDWVVISANGENFDGVFSANYIKTDAGWKIILEHTSSS